MSVNVPVIIPVAPFWAPAAWLREACMGAIGLYQRHLSPRKGYKCAHRALHRGESCSQFVKRVVGVGGVRQAIQLLGPRFEACREAAARCAAFRQAHLARAAVVRAQTARTGEQEGPNPVGDLLDVADAVDVAGQVAEVALDCGVLDGGALDCAAGGCAF